MPDEIREHDEQFVEGLVQQLMAHFDCCQVFVSRLEPDGRTLAFSTGRGNFYTRKGMIAEWLENGGVMHLEEVTDEPDDDAT